MKKPIRIALLAKEFEWAGGVELLRTFANALQALNEEKQIKLFLLLPIKNKIESFEGLKQNFLTMASTYYRQGKFLFPKKEPAFLFSIYDYFKNFEGEIEYVEYRDHIGLIPVLRKIEANIVLPAKVNLGKSFPFPWIGYFPDLQHKHYPNYFSANEALSRDIKFTSILRDAKAMIVNSRFVKNDIDTFIPYHKCNIFVLPFSASPISTWFECNSADIEKKYQLPSRYFLISNQFWIHKSHITAFKALAILHKEENYQDLHIVCTGQMADYRFPKHITDLKEAVNGLGLNKNVHFLGHIPKIEQISIMKKSKAVIQPTLFEGGPGGGSVYDAVSLGVPAIISDIPVNKEIEDEQNIFYFKAGSETHLAERMKSFLAGSTTRLSKDSLIAAGEHRKYRLGERLLEAIDFVRNEHRASR